MDLQSFRAAYERKPASRAEYDEDPDRIARLAKAAAQLSPEDPSRAAIEAYIAARAQAESYSAVEHLAFFGVEGHLSLLWSLTRSDHMHVRIAAADVLCGAGHSDRAWPILEELLPQAVGRHPKVPGWRLLEAARTRPAEQARELLWGLTRVASSHTRASAVRAAFGASLPEGLADDPRLAGMMAWAELPLEAVFQAVRRDLQSGELSSCWWMRDAGEERPDHVSALIRAVRGPALPRLEEVTRLPVRHQNEVLFWTVKSMVYVFDPLDYWSGRWDSPWPVGGPQVVRAVDPPWALAALTELLALAEEGGAHAIAEELRAALSQD